MPSALVSFQPLDPAFPPSFTSSPPFPQPAAEPTLSPSAASTPNVQRATRNSARRKPWPTPSSTAITCPLTQALPPQWPAASGNPPSHQTRIPWDPPAESRLSRHRRDTRRQRRMAAWWRRANTRARRRIGVKRAIGFRVSFELRGNNAKQEAAWDWTLSRLGLDIA